MYAWAKYYRRRATEAKKRAAKTADPAKKAALEKAAALARVRSTRRTASAKPYCEEGTPRFKLVIPALFWARLVRGAPVHGLRWPGSAFGFGIEIHRLRRSHLSIP